MLAIVLEVDLILAIASISFASGPDIGNSFWSGPDVSNRFESRPMLTIALKAD